jgi:Transposase
VPVAEICRKAGISQATYFNWKKKYDGLLPTEMRRLKQLEDENGKPVHVGCTKSESVVRKMFHKYPNATAYRAVRVGWWFWIAIPTGRVSSLSSARRMNSRPSVYKTRGPFSSALPKKEREIQRNQMNRRPTLRPTPFFCDPIWR